MTVAPPTNCTFSETDWRILARFWYPVALATEVQTAPFAIKLLDKKLVAFRHSKGVAIFDDLCPHRGVPLSMGRLEGDQLVCRGHGLQFNSEGRCNGSSATLRYYPVAERYGLIWTCLDISESTPEIPAFPQWNNPDFEAIPAVAMKIKAAAGRQVESFIDVAHFAWIHADSFSDPKNPVVPKYQVEETPNGIRTIYASGQPNMPKELHHLIPEGFVWVRDYTISLPFTAALLIHLPHQNKIAILDSACPVSARETRLFAPTARNFDKGESLDPFYKFQYQIFGEDQVIVEQQHPEDLPIALSEEVHIRADRTSIAYRSRLGKLGLGRLYTT